MSGIELAVTNAIARCLLPSKEQPPMIDHDEFGHAPGYVSNRALLEDD